MERTEGCGLGEGGQTVLPNSVPGVPGGGGGGDASPKAKEKRSARKAKCKRCIALQEEVARLKQTISELELAPTYPQEERVAFPMAPPHPPPAPVPAFLNKALSNPLRTTPRGERTPTFPHEPERAEVEVRSKVEDNPRPPVQSCRSVRRSTEADFSLSGESRSRLRELESSLSNGSGLEREDKEKRGSVYIVPLSVPDMMLNVEKNDVTCEEVLKVSEVLHPSRWILQCDSETSFAICTKAGLRFLYLHYDEAADELSVSEDDMADTQDKWIFVPDSTTATTQEMTYKILHCRSDKYLSVQVTNVAAKGLSEKIEEGIQNITSMESFGKVEKVSRRDKPSLVVSLCMSVAASGSVWCIKLCSVDTSLFLYQHRFNEAEKETIRKSGGINSVMPETYSAVSLIRNGCEPECDAQQAASKVIKSRAVMEWRRTALLLITISCVVETFDSVSDIQATVEYWNHGHHVFGLVSVCILAVSGLIRGGLSFYIVLTDSQQKWSTWTCGDVFIICLSMIPVPLADVLEAVRVVQGLLEMDDASFLVLKPVRTGRMQLRSAATSMAESFPQLCLQAYAFFNITRSGDENETILVLSLLMSFVAILWSVITYCYVTVIEERGPLLEVFDLSDRELKKAIGQPSSVGVLHSMTGKEFSHFLQCVSECSFGRVHFDDVQLLIDHARNLFESWADPSYKKSGWVKKEFFLCGCSINWYHVMQVSTQKYHLNNQTEASEILANELSKEISPRPSGLSLLMEIALELNIESDAFAVLMSNSDDTARLFQGHVKGMRFFSTEFVFMGAVAGGRSLDRHGARYAAAMIRGQRVIKKVILSGNRFGMAEEESPLQSYDLERVTVDTFETLEALGGCAVNGRCDLADFKSGFRLFPQLHSATLNELFKTIASSVFPAHGDDDDRTISLQEWQSFAKAYPKMLLALYHRLRAGISQLLSAVIYSSSISGYCLECVDVRGCNLTNSELWSIARTCIVDCIKPIHFYVEGGNGSKGVDAFVQQVMDHGLEGLRALRIASSNDSEKSERSVSFNTDPDASPIDAKCVLEVSDLVRFSCTLLDHSARRRRISERECKTNPLKLLFMAEVRVPDSVWEETDECYLNRRTLLILDNLLECQSLGVIVSWKARGLHGCVNALLEAAEEMRQRRSSVRRSSDVMSVVHADLNIDLSRYQPRGSDIPVVLRLNTCLWKRGFNASCAPSLRLEWKLASKLISNVRVMFLRRERTIPTFELRAEDMELIVSDLQIAAEMIEAISRNSVDVDSVLPLMSFKDCSLDTTHTPVLSRLLQLGIRYCDVSGNNLGDEDLVELLGSVCDNFSCIDFLRNPKLESYPASVARRIEQFRETHPETMLCLPVHVTHTAAAWKSIARGNSTPVDLGLQAFRKPSVPLLASIVEQTDAYSPPPSPTPTEPQCTGLSNWRDAMRQMNVRQDPPLPAADLPGNLATWHSPKGTLYAPEVIQQLQNDCALVEKQWESFQSEEVVVPIYMFSTSLKRQFFWILGVSSSGHRCGLKWELLENTLILELEASLAVANNSNKAMQVNLPAEKMAELGLSSSAVWARDEVSSGMETYSCGIARLARYANPAPGDAGTSPLHDSVLWLPRPGTAFVADSETHYNNLPYSGVVEYVAQHLPEQCMGGRGWREGRSSYEAAADPQGDYDWVAIPIMNAEWSALVRECLAQLNPCHFDARILKKVDALLDAPELEAVVIDGTLDSLGIQFKESRGEILLCRAPPELAYFLGREIHQIDNARITSIDHLLKVGRERCKHELLFSEYRGHFRGVLRTLVRAPLEGGVAADTMFTPAEISRRLQIHLVSFSRNGRKKNILLGATGTKGFVMGCFLGGNNAFALQRLADDRFEQPAEVVNSTVQAIFDGHQGAVLTLNAASTLTADKSVSESGRVIFSNANEHRSAYWEPEAKYTMDSDSGAWVVLARGSAHHSTTTSFERYGWMLDQIRPFAQALSSALSKVDNLATLQHTSHVQQDFDTIKYRRDINLASRRDVGGIAIWGSFSLSREGHVQEGEMDTAAPHTVFMLKGKSCKFVAPWCRETKLLESMSKYGSIWKVTAVLSQRQRHFMGQQTQQVIEMTELTRAEALFVYLSECIDKSNEATVYSTCDKFMRGTLYDLMKYRPLVESAEDNCADAKALESSTSALLSMLYQFTACDELFEPSPLLPFTQEILHQIVDLLMAFGTPLDMLRRLSKKMAGTKAEDYYGGVLQQYSETPRMLSPFAEHLQSGRNVPHCELR